MNTQTSGTDTSTSTRKYTRRSEAQWRELIRGYEHSELTLEAYCQEHHIAPSGFYTWRKRFEQESEHHGEALVDITTEVATAATQRKPVNKSWQVELELGSGCILRIATR